VEKHGMKKFRAPRWTEKQGVPFCDLCGKPVDSVAEVERLENTVTYAVTCHGETKALAVESKYPRPFKIDDPGIAVWQHPLWFNPWYFEAKEGGERCQGSPS
jgi:hypothetical protein